MHRKGKEFICSLQGSQESLRQNSQGGYVTSFTPWLFKIDEDGEVKEERHDEGPRDKYGTGKFKFT